MEGHLVSTPFSAFLKFLLATLGQAPCTQPGFWAQIPALPLSARVTPEELIYFLEPQCPHLKNGGIITPT